ncbi:hypothetical protein MASR2M12_01930 [Bacteroidales bacterium]
MRFALFLTLSLFLLDANLNFVAGQQAQTYESTLKSANEKLEAKDYISAKTYFEMALRIKPGDAVATKKLAETTALMKKQLEQQENFYAFLDQGDQLMKQGKADEALFSYQKALQIFPDDKYVGKQVLLIMDAKKAEQEKKQQFDQYRQLGEKLISEKKYDEALVQFNLALDLMPDHKETALRIAETRKTIEERNATEQTCIKLMNEADEYRKRKQYALAIEKIKEVQKLIPGWDDADRKIAGLLALERQQYDFEQVILKADQAYEQNNLTDARLFYENALQIISGEAYATGMINRIDTALGNEKIQQQKALDEALMTANQLFENGQYSESIPSYDKVLKLDPTNLTAQHRRAEAGQLLEAETAKRKALEQFEQLMADGDKAFRENNPEAALTQYQNALKVLPDNESAHLKIADCQRLIQENIDADTKMAQYQQLITQADALFAAGSFAQARQAYEKAQPLNPSSSHPTEQLQKLVKAIDNQAMIEKIQKQYLDLITTADLLFNEKKFDVAAQNYTEARKLKPDENYPPQQIQKIEEILSAQKESQLAENKFNELINHAIDAENKQQLETALELYVQAAAIKPNEILPNEKIGRLRSRIVEQQAVAEKEKAYNELLAEADRLFGKDDFQQAIENYRKSLTLNSTAEYPQKQIKAAEKALNEQKALAERDEAYQQAVAHADQLFDRGEFPAAIEKYSQALKLKPGSQYPTEQMAQAAKQLETKEAARQKELTISNLLNEAEQMLSSKNYSGALGKYSEVLRLDPNHVQANEKLSEVNRTLEALAREREEGYQAAMDEAEQNISIKEYKKALSSLNAALGFKPNDEAAQKRIKQVDAIIEERLMALRSEYYKAVAEADRFYNSRSYDQAIEKYLFAEGVKPDETYPREMIKKIATLIEENKIRELNTAAVLIPANTTKRFNFDPVDVTERRSNYILVKVRNTGNGDFPLLVNFGSKSGRNGGFVLPIPNNGELNDYIVKIGQQYKWFSEDNTWIEFLPENGTVEISILQISKGDSH